MPEKSRPKIPARYSEKKSLILNGTVLDYTLTVSRLARNVHLKIDPAHGLEIVIPRRFSPDRLPSIIKDRRHWIIKKLADRQAANEHKPRLQSGESITVCGVPKMLVINPKIGYVSVLRETADRIIINIADKKNQPSLAHLELTAKKLLEKHLRKIAEKYFASRTAEISRTMGTRYGTITIRSQKTRWGSCSRQNNLNFNWKLVLMPLPVIDYIIIHELAHTIHHNHGALFHALVQAHCPNYRQLKKILRENRMPF